MSESSKIPGLQEAVRLIADYGLSIPSPRFWHLGRDKLIRLQTIEAVCRLLSDEITRAGKAKGRKPGDTGMRPR